MLPLLQHVRMLRGTCNCPFKSLLKVLSVGMSRNTGCPFYTETDSTFLLPPLTKYYWPPKYIGDLFMNNLLFVHEKLAINVILRDTTERTQCFPSNPGCRSRCVEFRVSHVLYFVCLSIKLRFPDRKCNKAF